MKKTILTLALLLLMSYAALAQTDAEGCKDDSLFTRFPNFYISECSENYNELKLRMSSEKSEVKEGNLKSIVYYFNSESGEKEKSPLQIMKNYENAVVKNGGKMVYRNTDALGDELEATFHLTAKDKEYWVKIGSFGGTANEVEHYTLYILEMEAMKQEIQASEMMNALNKDGFIALYINFETGKSDIKPESQEIVNQIAVMLKQNIDLKISIEGHTDNVGSDKSNQTLSENRATSVMKALIALGIDKTRLTSKGWGASKPIADNRTEEGKAKNRRVEIVKL
ncbi:MAG: OmpA family protein [Bacteroidetes bacterium]|nr:OmpA family protein [Bacteroidota bacterium]